MWHALRASKPFIKYNYTPLATKHLILTMMLDIGNLKPKLKPPTPDQCGLEAVNNCCNRYGNRMKSNRLKYFIVHIAFVPGLRDREAGKSGPGPKLETGPGVEIEYGTRIRIKIVTET
ncbi:hypothetical protein EVAR_28261_1 [Eumeta japonica]|uniref:Uncharacterized protein n=1 Tax=Eumeta variegata TaxID=151549 RepID=A0A4C1V761_EUMVA|nr:hypothetical protein EVAR_28261_1 [Eumeta japonica]